VLVYKIIREENKFSRGEESIYIIIIYYCDSIVWIWDGGTTRLRIYLQQIYIDDMISELGTYMYIYIYVYRQCSCSVFFSKIIIIITMVHAKRKYTIITCTMMN